MENKPAVTFHTLGCKMNQAETELLAGQFIKAGFCVASNGSADVCILNTCTVTHIADRKSRHLLRLLRKRNPEALIVATGCYAERASQALVDIGVDLIIGNDHKMDIPELVKKNIKSEYVCSNRIDPDCSLRVRSFIKIQDGCRDFCAYCVVPLVRRRKFSVPIDEIIALVKAKVSAGYKEVILTGTEIGAYNYRETDLRQVIEVILKQTEIPRLRLSSLQPGEISEDLIGMWANPRLCNHFHMALQSGSDAVLKRMKRRYSLCDYAGAASIIRRTVPDAAITTDIMVGFPGESDAEFQESYGFCLDTGFADIHVFSYSSRPGTAAAVMLGHVNEKLKKERSLRMLALAKECAVAFQKKFIGRTVTVLWEGEVKPATGLYSGFTGNYIRVYTQSRQQLSDSIVPVRLLKAYRDGLWGEIVA